MEVSKFNKLVASRHIAGYDAVILWIRKDQYDLILMRLRTKEGFVVASSPGFQEIGVP